MEVQIKDITLEIMKLTNGNICKRCLGRSFSKTIAGPGNLIRGEYLRKTLEDTNENIPKSSACYICNDLFDDLDTMIDKIIEVIETEDIHFSNFLVGCRVDP